MTDVTPPPAAAEPPAVPAATPTEIEVVPPKKKSGALGGFALILAILAILGDIVVIIFGVVTLATAVNGFDMSTFEFGPILAALGAFAAIAVFAFFGGMILAVLALLLRPHRRGQGPRAGGRRLRHHLLDPGAHHARLDRPGDRADGRQHHQPDPVLVTEAPAPYTGMATPAVATAADDAPRRGLGIWSLVLGLLAVIGDVIVVIVVADAARSVTVDINSGLANLFVAAVTAVIIMVGGFLVSITGLILGILAVARGRGRVPGVIGLLLCILVVLSYVLAIILVAVGGSGLATIATWV